MNKITLLIGAESFDMGAGRYSPVMREFASDLHRYYPTLESSGHYAAAAKCLGADLGRLASQVDSKGVKVSKLSKKDGSLTVREVSTALAAGDLVTPALKTLRMVQLLNQCEFLQTRPQVQPSEEIVRWLDGLKPVAPMTKDEMEADKRGK